MAIIMPVKDITSAFALSFSPRSGDERHVLEEKSRDQRDDHRVQRHTLQAGFAGRRGRDGDGFDWMLHLSYTFTIPSRDFARVLW